MQHIIKLLDIAMDNIQIAFDKASALNFKTNAMREAVSSLGISIDELEVVKSQLNHIPEEETL